MYNYCVSKRWPSDTKKNRKNHIFDKKKCIENAFFSFLSKSRENACEESVNTKIQYFFL